MITKSGVRITDTSKALFLDYARDAGNWSGTPLVGGNVGGDVRAQRGNLTQLKRAGLITTSGKDEDGNVWLYFTEAGIDFAKENGVDIEEYRPKSGAKLVDLYNARVIKEG